MDLEFDVVDLEETDHPKAGDVAPDFTRPLVNTEFWEDVSISELAREKPVLLVFYTMDSDFPATYIWNEIRDRAWEKSYEIEIVGCSISTPYEHKTLLKERGMGYRLFSDPQNGVAKSYDIVNDLDGMAGVSEARPAVFLLDSDRTVEYAWVASEWPDFPDYDAVEDALATFCSE
jgi:peroxiredoxin